MKGSPLTEASFTNLGDVYIYDFNKMEQAVKLKGHSEYKFGQCWQPPVYRNQSNILVSASTDRKISI